MAQPILDLTEQDGVTIVRFPQKRIADSPMVDLIRERLEKLAIDGHVRIVVDFEGVTYLSSSGIGALVALNQHLRRSKGRLCVCNIPAELQKIFRIGSFDKLFTFRDDLVGALAFMEGSAGA